MKFKKTKDGEWVQPIKKGYKIKCCDCGLVHKVDFRIKNGNIQFRAYREFIMEKIKNIKSESMFIIDWYDARFFSGTYTKEDCKKHNMCLFKSLGYIISKNKTITRIAAERNNEGQYRDITLIPTGSIVSIMELIPKL